MAQASTPMGPPMSPREIRRSGRRSIPSASTSTSKSPESSILESSRPKESSRKLSAANPSSTSRSKRLKQEDMDDSVDDHRNTSSNGSGTQSTNSRAKRKSKEKEKPTNVQDQADESGTAKSKSSLAPKNSLVDGEDEEEQGITRCICGSTVLVSEDDQVGGEFMVQCETCQVWQHGRCMGYESVKQLRDDDYYCEKCRPELHVELLKKPPKKLRHSSANSRPSSIRASSRISRSHSPSQLIKPSKRRNTMNSLDAAFDESLKEIMEATAAEAAAAQLPSAPPNSTRPIRETDLEAAEVLSQKKRKRTEDDSLPKKRTRSASTTSDHPGNVHANGGDTIPPVIGSRIASGTISTKPSRSNKRGGGGRKVVQDVSVMSESIENMPKRSANSNRPRAVGNAKRALNSVASHNAVNMPQEHPSRRSNYATSGQMVASQLPSVETSRAYRNSHAYVVAQQPLFTSWNLPDYLSHLEAMLPTNAPRPLEVRGNGSRESLESTMERGVKVKWPSKRMSVGDMNKRVRALLEWVGREQANALDRGRRRVALEEALRAPRPPDSDDEAQLMVLDVIAPIQSPVSAAGERRTSRTEMADDLCAQSGTMKIMEELMRELIVFQEKFGPAMKTRDRERRTAAT